MRRMTTLEKLGRPMHDYSTVAEVSNTRLVFLAGQIPWDEN